MTLHFTVGRLRCSRIPPRFRYFRFKCGIRVQSVGSELLVRQGNYAGTGYTESAARQQIAIKFLVSRKLEANRAILMPKFFGRDLALVASGSFVAIRSRRSGSDRRYTPDSWVSASRIGADNHALAEIIDAGEFSCRSIGIEVHRGL